MTSKQKLAFSFNTNNKYVPFVDSNMNVCVCDRKERTIHCTGCGFITKGRLTRQCKFHPWVIYLHDFKSCPFCETPAEFMKEYVTSKTVDPNNN